MLHAIHILNGTYALTGRAQLCILLNPLTLNVPREIDENVEHKEQSW